MIGNFPGEPFGAEAAIGWHLRQIDHHDNEATMADAIGEPFLVPTIKHHEAKAHEHRTRLDALEVEFPETARVARRDLEAEYRRAGEDA